MGNVPDPSGMAMAQRALNYSAFIHAQGDGMPLQIISTRTEINLQIIWVLADIDTANDSRCE